MSSIFSGQGEMSRGLSNVLGGVATLLGGLIFLISSGEDRVFLYSLSAFMLTLAAFGFSHGKLRKLIGSLISLFFISLSFYAVAVSDDLMTIVAIPLVFGVPGAIYIYIARFGIWHNTNQYSSKTKKVNISQTNSELTDTTTTHVEIELSGKQLIDNTRGIPLASLIIYMLISNLLFSIIYALLPELATLVTAGHLTSDERRLFGYTYALICLLKSVTILFIWLKKKIAVFSYVIIVVINVLITALLLQSVITSIYILIGSLFIPAVLLSLIRNKWHIFS
ncbi:hypothetical protein [Corallincola spongiicola]|uniref:DUF2232 domain-containing protein n=1 Tax=Corallincola spongiicola TaxID=2520508 RepID=A0ABY1WMT2_9GAMM|nr:hypothetical protein [Corallincola spongiicola]TAA43632.1 hypothetical protein EXY25_13840 [Corallincola spongiicola]